MHPQPPTAIRNHLTFAPLHKPQASCTFARRTALGAILPSAPRKLSYPRLETQNSEEGIGGVDLAALIGFE